MSSRGWRRRDESCKTGIMKTNGVLLIKSDNLTGVQMGSESGRRERGDWALHINLFHCY